MESEMFEKIYSTITKQIRAAVVILISVKIDFNTNTVERDKERHFVMTTGSTQW